MLIGHEGLIGKSLKSDQSVNISNDFGGNAEAIAACGRGKRVNRQGDVEMLKCRFDAGTSSGNLGRYSPMEDSEFKAIGVDGCRSGWFYVVLNPSGRPDWGVVRKA